MLWAVRYQKKKGVSELHVLPTHKKRTVKTINGYRWYNKMKRVHKNGKLSKLVFIRNFAKLEKVDVEFTKAEDMRFGFKRYTNDGTSDHNPDLRVIETSAGVRVLDIIRRFQLGDDVSTRVDLEDEITTKMWTGKWKEFRNKCTKDKPLKVTFRQGLNILPEIKVPLSQRRRLFALSERFRRVREFQASA